MTLHTNPTLPLLHVGRGAQYGALTLFPVWADGGAATGLEWDLGALDIGEQHGGGQVNSLTAVNLGSKPVVLIEGDLLEGGWQTRMVAHSTIVAPNETTTIGALCVEHGRWEQGGSRSHRAAGRRVSATLRTARDRAYQRGASPQQAVWHGIASRYETHAPTATRSFADHLDRVSCTRGQRGERPLPTKPLDGQRGVIIGVGGRVLGMELLATPAALAKRWNGILEAALFDAEHAPEVATSGHRARAFAFKVEQAHINVDRESPSVVTLAATQGSTHLGGIALPTTERSIDAEFWRIVHLAAYNHQHPLLAGI
ncbi:hypothetical protein BST27_23000 [Mycobacterium intermedium]|uniref:ARG and Rhodanese-Phosphatase-superfamily-associated domain-containing protein n=1 Tax=Mycobacterium intermedium TaxID=28445 RepID=A0A1E3SL12_MYCIE|nr:DUF6569 family protein [Mycobacterium intermedium]MCV6962547.1 hypothetical protein [Mycobacterium intermedium]ODR02323.1 hypothetical protein BHQ20_04325 [Mycobacterium intermedium]OPE52845.1 hypothetical protein BV508_01055 [Mycobacterium intermedium]ORA97174.1 hypothetical protein BST27_23000 [Mycobacterium intermedium]